MYGPRSIYGSFYCLKETSQSLKYCLKTFLISKPYKCVSSVGRVRDDILWNLMLQNAANVYDNKNKLPSICS